MYERGHSYFSIINLLVEEIKGRLNVQQEKGWLRLALLTQDCHAGPERLWGPGEMLTLKQCKTRNSRCPRRAACPRALTQGYSCGLNVCVHPSSHVEMPLPVQGSEEAVPLGND